MSDPITVLLPSDCIPEWPSHCIGCEAEAEETVRCRISSPSLKQILLWFIPGISTTTEFPVCGDCRCLIRNYKIRRLQQFSLIFIGPIIIAGPLIFLNVPDHIANPVMLVGAFVGPIAFLVWDLRNRHPILEVAPNQYGTEYEFENRNIAQQFFALNPLARFPR